MNQNYLSYILGQYKTKIQQLEQTVHALFLKFGRFNGYLSWMLLPVGDIVQVQQQKRESLSLHINEDSKH